MTFINHLQNWLPCVVSLAGGALIAYLIGYWQAKRLRKEQQHEAEIAAQFPQQKRELAHNLKMATNDLAHFCKKNPKLVQPYLILGNLYRLIGEHQRSVLVHQNLLTEPHLEQNTRDRVLLELANDLMALGLDDRAGKTLTEIDKNSPLYSAALEKLVIIYSKNQNYEKAYQVMESIFKKRRTWHNRKRTAYYLALHSEQFYKSTDHPSAKKYAKKALDYDRYCILAMFTLGSIALEEKHFDEAIDHFEQLVTTKPEFAFLAVPKIEDAYYGKQSFMKLGDTLEKLAEQQPRDPYLQFSLGKYYRKKKMYNEARQHLEQSLESIVNFRPACEELIYLNDEEQKSHKTIDNFKTLIDESKAATIFSCSNCNRQTSELSWQCSNCGHWETLSPQFSMTPISRKLLKEHGEQQLSTDSL